MKIVVTSQAEEVSVGESSLRGKCLVQEEDEVGYTCYDVVLEQGTSQDIKSAIGEDFNHIYYCVFGEINFECSEGTNITLKDDHVIALTGQMKAKITAASKTRLFITYVKKTSEELQPQKAFHYSLDMILGTERDVDWKHGRSRRFLRQAENFNVSVHNTLCSGGHASPLHYVNNKESCLYVEGDVKYTWDDGKAEHSFKQADRRDGDGACITMDKNDQHVIHAAADCITLCVFYPALKGTETHDFSKPYSQF